MRTLIVSLLLTLPQLGFAQDNRCTTYQDQEICDCASLAASMRICGSWESAWINLPAQDGVLALLQAENGGITTINGSQEDIQALPETKDRYLAVMSNVTDVRELPAVTLDGFEAISFTGTLTHSERPSSPIAVTMIAGEPGTFLFETIFPNAFGLPQNAVLSAEMQATHESLFDLIEMNPE